MKKIILIVLIVVVVLILGVILFLGYLGLVPGVANLFGSNKPRDLGVTWTAADYQAVHKRTGVEVVSKTGEVSDKESLVSEGEHTAKLTISGTELTAIINNNSANWKYFPVSDVQVKLNSDGSAEMSGMIYLDRLAGYAAATGANYKDIKTGMDYFKFLPKKIPFYVAATPSITNNAASLNFSKVELSRISIPQNLISDNTNAINNFFTQQINAFPGLSTKSADFKDGQLNFDGTLSDKVTTFK